MRDGDGETETETDCISKVASIQLARVFLTEEGNLKIKEQRHENILCTPIKHII